MNEKRPKLSQTKEIIAVVNSNQNELDGRPEDPSLKVQVSWPTIQCFLLYLLHSNFRFLVPDSVSTIFVALPINLLTQLFL